MSTNRHKIEQAELPRLPQQKVTFPKPTLRPQDLIMMVELKTETGPGVYKTLGVFSQDCSACQRNCNDAVRFDLESMHTFSWTKPNPFSETIRKSTSWDCVPTDDVVDSIFDELCFSIRFFRQDNGCSVCLSPAEDWMYNEIDIERGDSFAVANTFFSSSQLRPDPQSSAGALAQQLCLERKINVGEVEMYVEMEPVLPVKGSREEPAWLKEARADQNGSISFADWKDDPELLSTKEFEYRLVRMESFLCISKHDSDEADDYFQSTDDMMLFFEGLDWK